VLSNLDHLTASVIRTAAGLLCFCAMVTCILWAVVISLDRVEQVNSRLPADQQIGFTFGVIGPERHWRFEKEYERFFPDRSLRRKERILWLLGAVFLAGLVLCAAPLF